MNSLIFKDQYQLYRDAGFEPRPVKPGTKGCKLTDWNEPDSVLGPGFYEQSLHQCGRWGIGLRLGTIFPDGTSLAALDVDDDRYVRAASYLLGNPAVGRVGSRGIAWLVRMKGNLEKKAVFNAPGPNGAKVHVGELLGSGSLLVLPPTIHPVTQRPYQWVGTPLLEAGYAALPIIEV